jgi:hypothetical protein
VFLNSHLLTETERLCSRVGILHRGQLVREERLEGRRTTPGMPGATALLLSESLPERTASELRLRDLGESRYHLEHSDLSGLNQVIDGLRARGSLIVEVQRIQVSIEDALAEVATSTAQVAVATTDEAVEEAPPPHVSPFRGLRAIARVARELFADLVARRILHVAVAGAVLLLALLVYISHDEIAKGLAASGRLLRSTSDPSLVTTATATFAGGMALGAHWLMLVSASFLAALFAPPLLNPRRILLLQSQPIARGDIAAGITLSVCVIALAMFSFFDTALFGAMRFLGADITPRFLLVPLVTTLSFAAVYVVTLLVTYIFPNGLFAALVGVGQLIALSVLNSLPAGRLGKAHGVGGFVLGVLPRVDDLGFVAKSLGSGARVQAFPVVSTALYTLAMILLLQLTARRSER